MGANHHDFEAFASIKVHLTRGWLDPGTPAPVDNHWARSEHPPEPGTERMVSTVFPRPAADHLWFDFVPGLGAENGWEDYPETIRKSAFAYCQVLADEGPVLRVAVEDVIDIGQLERRFPARSLPRFETLQLSDGSLVVDGDLELLLAYMEDARYWLLARRGAEAVHLLAASESYGFGHYDEVIWAGHGLLTHAEWRRLCQNFSRPPAI